MNLSPEMMEVMGLILGGAFYDNFKTAILTSYELTKEKIKKYLPIKDTELKTITNEIKTLPNDITKEKLISFINNNEKINAIFENIYKREPIKVKEIVDSFRRNNKTAFDISLGEEYFVKDSFNDNNDCKIVIR